MADHAMITIADDYFSKGCGRCARFATPDCSTRRWIDGLNDLRRICLDMGLVEVVKWGHPCYMYEDRNIAMIGAFRGDFLLTMFNAALLKDPEGILKKRGPNARVATEFNFTDTAEVVAQEEVIRTYIAEAIGYAKAGIKPEKIVRDIDMPDELTNALDDDPELAEAFDALTPGRQRSYMFNLNSAKNSSTRVKRIAKFRDKIIAGKGALER
ncbi:YdeI/OmpD-associated family protein [Abyssibius alkaniclasticus]|uniref:YdeI/OmpD-associated family protein n=1 Tax=Abyssibius alkaniclasticus TaxID=2881234 RepID=UPI002363846D|nr:YdeI/OmpD-associated family protein [Abyssibius alkaniclasticus]UPH72151.1 YdeI/OmpD-associated family protein [Abyssibius alkaniclasticus]